MVVIVEIVVEPSLGDGSSKRPSTEQFLLDRPVKAFNVGVVIALADAAMPKGDVFATEHIFEPGAELGAVVGLDGLEREAEETLGLQQGLVAPALRDPVMDSRVSHSGMEINDSVEIELLLGPPIQEVDGIRLDE